MKYAYKCTKCSKEFEFDYPIGQAPQELKGECNADGPTMFKRLYKTAGVVFKGPGFYSTDKRKYMDRLPEVSRQLDKRA